MHNSYHQGFKILFLIFSYLFSGSVVYSNEVIGYDLGNELNSNDTLVQISGRITDLKGGGLPGVTIVVEGTSNGTSSDIDGRYSLNISDRSKIIIYSFIGFETQEVAISNRRTIDVVLLENSEKLGEVVITALGIKKEKIALGYASTKITTDLIEDRPEGDIARILSGKVAGLDITNSSGLSGSATNVIIRGFTSFSGSNQALFVVDGVPFNNETQSSAGGFFNNTQASSRAFDIDPNDIESVEVLKGLAATTLYGADGVNGVILITTKSGNGNSNSPNMTFTQSLFFSKYANKPEYQKQYGQGDFGVFDSNSFDSWGPSYEKNGFLGWGNDPNIDDDGTYQHYYSESEVTEVQNGFPNLNETRLPYKPQQALEEFLTTGFVSNTSVNATTVSENGKSSFNLGLGHLNDRSFVPGNAVVRSNVSAGGRSEITDRLTVRGSLRFTITDLNTPRSSFDFSGTSGRGGLFPYVLIIPRNIDWASLPHANPIDNSNVFFRRDNDSNHPLWLVNNLKYNQKTNRSFWSLDLDFKVIEGLSINWRSSQDWYNTRDFNTINRGGILAQGTGYLEKINRIGNNWNHLFTINGAFSLSEKMNIDFNVGTNIQNSQSNFNSLRLNDQVIFNRFTIRNFTGESPNLSESQAIFNQLGLLGQVSLDYNKYLYMNLSARSDWVSNLQPGFNNAFYPSVSLSFIPTRAFSKIQTESGLNFLKLRSSLGTSTRFPRGYPIDASITQTFDPIQGVVLHTLNGDADQKITPETVTEYEFGVESRFFNNRGSIDFSIFKRITNNIISTIDAPASTGNLGSIQTNTGRADSKGLELDLGYDLVKKDKFLWNSKLNFFSHRETLIRRDNPYAGISNNAFEFGSFANIGRNAAIVGKSLGSIVGSRILRNDEGIPIIDMNGNYITDNRDEDGNFYIVGDAIPDFRTNLYNSINYHNWTFGFMVHFTKGGDLFTQAPATLLGRGLTVDNLSDHGNVIVIEGVKEDGMPNNTPITPERYWKNNVAFGPTELRIYDASLIRLQEISLSYDFSQSFMKKLPFRSMSILATAHNLWFRALSIPKGLKVDTNTLGPGPGNNRGIDYSGSVSSSRFGLSLKIAL